MIIYALKIMKQKNFSSFEREIRNKQQKETLVMTCKLAIPFK